MNNVRKKFVRYAMLSIFALLTVILTIINGVNFTMATEDADMVTQMLCEKHGHFSDNVSKDKNSDSTHSKDVPFKVSKQHNSQDKMGPMGPDSPDMTKSLRYFTYSFDKDGNAKMVSHLMSAVDWKEASEWASTLVNEHTGWTRGTYRYRVYGEGDLTYVTIIDQGRELLPSYRILAISVFGEVFGLVISYIVLRLIGKKLFKPLEMADYKQKKFIANIEKEFKVPLTIINANTEIIEKETGSSDYTKSINRQVKKMIALVKDIGSLAIFESSDSAITKVNLSSTLFALLDYKKSEFEKKGIELEFDIENDIVIDGEEESIKRVLSELTKNSLEYSVKTAEFSLKKEKDRIILIQKNGTDLPSGNADQIFDRFTVLENAHRSDAIGLGLSYVKDIVKNHNGRVSAKISDGEFILKIAL